jgi:hypothetical protein
MRYSLRESIEFFQPYCKVCGKVAPRIEAGKPDKYIIPENCFESCVREYIIATLYCGSSVK